MGEAKQRGTYEERKAAAIKRDEKAMKPYRRAYNKLLGNARIRSVCVKPRRVPGIIPLLAAMCGMGSPYENPSSKIAPMSKSTDVRARRKAAKQGRGR